jgi:hypothetical protein
LRGAAEPALPCFRGPLWAGPRPAIAPLHLFRQALQSPRCAILAGDFFVGKALYDLYAGPRHLAGLRQWLQFLNPGWWLVHTIGITAIYSLGRILWR